MGDLLDAAATAARPPFAGLVDAIESLLGDPAVRVLEVAAGRARQAAGPVLFKSCGWAGRDLAAATAA